MKYNGFNYEKYEDRINKYDHVESTFIYGNLNAIGKPWLTVLIPTYKRCDLLEEALKSILKQWHTDFFWDVIVLDNEPYDGEPNETEELIRDVDNDRVLYYRNSENLKPGDNFNRGIKLARGQWVTILHDDDLLMSNALQRLKVMIESIEKTKKTLGAISAGYVQFSYDMDTKKTNLDVPGINSYLCDVPFVTDMVKLSRSAVLMTGHIGGNAPTNGTTYNRSAVIEMGGFNEDAGIYADLVLYYNLNKKYALYQTRIPLGFYRWGCNLSMKPETTYKLINENHQFREYVYSQNIWNKFIGFMLRSSHYKKFATDVINSKNSVSSGKIFLEDFDEIYAKRPNLFMYFIYRKIIVKTYLLHKRRQSNRLVKRERGSKWKLLQNN